MPRHPGHNPHGRPAARRAIDQIVWRQRRRPIVHNRLFFWFAYEGFRSSTNNTYQAFTETPQLRQLIRTARPNGLSARVLGDAGIEPRVLAILPRTCADFSFPVTCQTVVGGLYVVSPTG